MRRVATLLVVAMAVCGLALQDPFDPCKPGGPLFNEDRPWMCGSVEKSCATAEVAYFWRLEEPWREIQACECVHVCDPSYKHAGETGDRRWDPQCEARCNPRSCRCEHPCQTPDGRPGVTRRP